MLFISSKHEQKHWPLPGSNDFSYHVVKITDLNELNCGCSQFSRPSWENFKMVTIRQSCDLEGCHTGNFTLGWKGAWKLRTPCTIPWSLRYCTLFYLHDTQWIHNIHVQLYSPREIMYKHMYHNHKNIHTHTLPSHLSLPFSLSFGGGEPPPGDESQHGLKYTCSCQYLSLS